MVDQVVKDLKQVIRGIVSTDNEILESHSSDASIFKKRPRIVVFPKSAEDISRLVKYVNLANKSGAGLHLTARARGTDMTGGPLSDSIVVNVDKLMNKVEVLNEDKLHAVVESGVEFTLFEQQALSPNTTLPAYPSSKQYAAFGGMIMNDCAGEKSLRYGKMHNFVDWIEMILYDGSIIKFEELTRSAVKEKMAGNDLESSIYRQVVSMVEKYQALISAHHPPVSKNSSGYALWRVWDQDRDTFNLSQLLIGSQGTLGIMSRAGVRLVHEKPHRTLLVAYVRDWAELPALINQVLPFDPEILEAYDEQTLRVAMKYSAGLAKSIDVSVLRMWMMFGRERKYRRKFNQLPPLTLLIELAEDEVAILNKKIIDIQTLMQSKNLLCRPISKKTEYNKYWAIRRESYKLLKDHSPGKTAAVFIEDFCVNPDKLGSFFPKLINLLNEHGIQATIAGHAGNGNFHVIPLMDFSNQAEREKIIPVMQRVHDLIWEHGGTITAEHNDGILRTPFVEEQFGSDMYKLFREVKRIFDPNNIFNPGKKVGGSLQSVRDNMISNNPDQETKQIYA